MTATTDPLELQAAGQSTGARQSRRGSLGHMIQLDGVRALAIGCVMIEHFAGPVGAGTLVPWGELGVRLFFVLSGFLITGILLNCRRMVETTGQGRLITLRQFYARRFLRIFPVYYATLIVVKLLRVRYVSHRVWRFALYLQNFYSIKRGGFIPIGGHLWTLAIEEQFYLVWPLFILFSPRKLLLPVTCAAIAGAVAYRCIGAAYGVPWYWLLFPPYAALDCLALGALLAICDDPAGPWPRLRRALPPIFLWVGAPLLLLLCWLWSLQNTQRVQVLSGIPHSMQIQSMLTLGLTSFAVGLVSFWLVARAARGFGGVWGQLLQSRLLVFIGTISYGLYLFHGFIFASAHDLWPHIDRWLCLEAQGVIYAVAAVAIASVSWYLFERPLNSLKRYFPYALPARKADRV